MHEDGYLVRVEMERLSGENRRLRAEVAGYASQVERLRAENTALKDDIDAGAKGYCALMERHDALINRNAALVEALQKIQRLQYNDSSHPNHEADYYSDEDVLAHIRSIARSEIRKARAEARKE